MATYKALAASDIRTTRNNLNQLVDVIQADISGAHAAGSSVNSTFSTRRKYQIWVTGGIGPGVTGGLYQTVYDQDFRLQTANPIFDITFGLYWSGSVFLSASTGRDSTGKFLFPSNSMQMREKRDVYAQYAQACLGNAYSSFYAPWGSANESDKIQNAIFINFRRLFSRDRIKRETFAMGFYPTASLLDHGGAVPYGGSQANLDVTPTGSKGLFTDVGAAANRQSSVAGLVANVTDAARTDNKVGLLFYDMGILVLNAGGDGDSVGKGIVSGSQRMSGTVSGMTDAVSSPYVLAAGQRVLGGTDGNPVAKFIPDFVTSGSIDNILDHVASTRFQSGSQLTAFGFQNTTIITSTLYFCRASADEFNYSSNPTYIDSENRIHGVDANSNTKAFSFVTGIGLYDAQNRLLAMAKLSRPVEKNSSKDITFRVRLDF